MSVVETQTRTQTQTGSTPSGGGRGPGGTRNASGESPEGGGRRFLRAVVRAFPWALGAALGVAAGAYLTSVSGAGAPGIEGIQPSTDLVVLPAIAFGVVFVVHLLLQAAIGAAKHRRR